MKKIILLMGPTAAGKTDLAIEIADKKNVSIISVDSALIYQDMNIGTAKPSVKILQKYPHKLIDICTPEEDYCVNKFIFDAKRQIKKTFANGKIPLLVGGTAFYFNALEYGLSELPASTQQSREYFANLLQKKGVTFLHQELQKIDKKSSIKIHPNDSQRITRALEVYYLSGKPLSQLQGKKQGKLPYNLKKIVLMPPRFILHQRIEKRFLQMIEQGLITEVENLQKKYKLYENTASMRCVGYRQIWQYLAGNIDKNTMIEKAIIATRQLCKRQTTWFKSKKDVLLLEKLEIQKVFEYV